MINLSLLKTGVEAIKIDYTETYEQSNTFLLNHTKNANQEHKDRAYNESQFLLSKLKAVRQADLIYNGLVIIRNVLQDFKKGDFSKEKDEDWNENENGAWCPYVNFLEMRLSKDWYDDTLPWEINNFEEMVSSLNNLGLSECIEKFDDFIKHITSMVTLKRPFSEMLDLFQD